MLLRFSMLNQDSKVALAAVAGRQQGRVTWEQIRQLGVPKGTVSLWLRQGYLHRRLPRVYAVGHPAGGVEADLAEALLYAGPGAMLSHGTAAWWWGLLDEQPRLIHVSTPRQRRSQPGNKVHSRRGCERVLHKGFPVTTLPQTLVDLADERPLRTVRRALAKADYAVILDVRAIEAELGRGRTGSAKLRTALIEHQPRLAMTKSRLEVLMVELCEKGELVLPDINVYVDGWQVDALWREQRIAVELDGYGNHHTPAQLRRDRRKELALRSAGFIPVRYSEEQLEQLAPEVIADLRRLGAGRR